MILAVPLLLGFLLALWLVAVVGVVAGVGAAIYYVETWRAKLTIAAVAGVAVAAFVVWVW